MWTGDINADFTRNNLQSQTVHDSISSINLTPAWNSFEADFSCTYEREGVTHVSLLNHFFLSKDLLGKVVEAGDLHHPDNSSDHEPIFCVIKSLVLTQSVIEKNRFNPKPSWKSASNQQKEEYKMMLENRLNSIVIPTMLSECEDVHCQDPVPKKALEWLAAELLEGVQDSAEATLPVPKTSESNGKKPTPGFQTKVKTFKDTAYFWHQVWKSASSPINCQLYWIMKRTRNRYHFEFKKCQRAENIIKKSNLLDACLNGPGDLFKEIKKMRKSKKPCSDTIDGVSDDIPGHFKSIYEDLYNCVEDADEISDIKFAVENKITKEALKHAKKVTPEEVKKASASLKPGKGDLEHSFSSDCLKVDSEVLAEYKAVLISSFLIHSHIPQFLLLSTLVPIVKDKLGSIHVSKNYRSVCITSLVLKQID